MATVIVGGALANKPGNAGEAWVRMSWALGLRKLGHDVWFAEEIAPQACADANGAPAPFERSANRAWFERIVEEFGLAGRATLICGEVDEVAGVPYAALLERAHDAELLFNISGNLSHEELLAAPRARVYVDLDPGFTQLWHAEGVAPLRLEEHDFHVTVGLNIGGPGCRVPTCGFEWLPTLPPVLLERWPAIEPPRGPRRFTTVATWRGPYGAVRLAGEDQPLKHHELRRLIDLPRRTRSLDVELELALGIHPGDAADLAALRSGGWRIADPRAVAADPGAYRGYIQGSAAEISVAQGVYVGGRTGWFSDRTGCYLASGRPALVQDTGLAPHLPVGHGLVTFGDLEGAAGGVEAIASEYDAHAREARAIAERYLDSDVVLGDLLERVATESASS